MAEHVFENYCSPLADVALHVTAKVHMKHAAQGKIEYECVFEYMKGHKN